MHNQGCTLREIEGSPVLWTCKIQSAQHMIYMKNLRFSSHPRAKFRHQGLLGSAREQSWLPLTLIFDKHCNSFILFSTPFWQLWAFMATCTSLMEKFITWLLATPCSHHSNMIQGCTLYYYKDYKLNEW